MRLPLFLAGVVSVVIVIGIAGDARADDDAVLGLRMQTNAATVAQGETFQVDVILTVNGQDSVDEFELPDVSDFSIISETESQRSSFFQRGGRRQVVVEHRRTLLLRADDAGDLVVGEAVARLGNNSARAAPLKIKVTPAKKVARANTNTNAGIDSDDDDNNIDDEDGRATNEAATVAPVVGPGARFKGALPPVFLEVRPDKDTAWVGEQITVVVEVWTVSPLGSFPRVPGLKPPGFVCLPLDDGTRVQATQRTLGGKSYYVYPLTRDALFALTPGKQAVGRLSVEVSPAGSFFSRGQEVRVTSEPVVVDVKALPDAPTGTEGFAAGNVGAFQLSVSARPAVTKAGEPFTLVVEAVGHGNIDQLQLPTWAGNPNVRLFPPTEKRERRDVEGAVAGRVVQEVLVQPQEAADVEIPALTLTTFSPESGRYVTSSSRPLRVRVSGAAGAKKARAQTKSTLVAGPRPLALDAAARDAVVGNGVVVAGGGVFVSGAFVGALLSLRRRRQDTQQAQHKKRLAARALAVKEARDLATAQRLLLDALADRVGDDVRAAPHAELPALLVAGGLSATLAERVVILLQAIDAARFAPGGAQQRLKEEVAVIVLAVDSNAVDSADAATGGAR